jgi:hypothetical protein
MGHGLVTALEGPRLRHLTASAQAAPELPAIGGVRAAATPHLHHGRAALQGPQRLGKAMGSGPLEHQLEPVLPLRVGQRARRPRRRPGGPSGLAPSGLGSPPAVARADGGLYPACHLAWPAALGEQHEGSPSFNTLMRAIRAHASEDNGWPWLRQPSIAGPKPADQGCSRHCI